MATTAEVQRIERDVVRLRLAGFKHQEIADMLQIKRYRVHDAIVRVYRRLNVHSVEELYGAMLEQQECAL